MKRLTGLFIEVGERPTVRSIDNSLDNIQNIVGGYLEVITLSPSLLLIASEDGFQLDGDSANVFLSSGADIPTRTIYGNVFIVSILGENFMSLDKEQLQAVRKAFSEDRQLNTIELSM